MAIAFGPVEQIVAKVAERLGDDFDYASSI